MTNLQLAIQFFLQLGIILVFCRIVGAIAARFGQPQVVAEMIAGVCMGPSLLGLFWPEAGEALFPKESMKVLFPVSQLGLALYMFIVGLEFRVDIVRKRFGSSVAVSLAGMAAPFLLGAGLGWAFHGHTSLFPEKTSLQNAMIFMGASMCITAFPMLARIIHFKGLAGTTMGTVAIGAGAIDDAAAWGMLAVVLASFNGDFSHAVLSIGGIAQREVRALHGPPRRHRALVHAGAGGRPKDRQRHCHGHLVSRPDHLCHSHGLVHATRRLGAQFRLCQRQLVRTRLL